MRAYSARHKYAMRAEAINVLLAGYFDAHDFGDG